MSEFLKWLDEKSKDFPMHIKIEYSKICDWTIYIYKKGYAKDYPDSVANGEDTIICSVQDPDMELAFAKAQIETKEWLLEHTGGY